MDKKANDKQVAGTHYRDGAGQCLWCDKELQHWDLAWMFDWDPYQYQITKYLMRWQRKNGVQDLKKAAHFLQKYIELVELETEKTDREFDIAVESILAREEPPSTRNEEAITEYREVRHKIIEVQQYYNQFWAPDKAYFTHVELGVVFLGRATDRDIERGSATDITHHYHKHLSQMAMAQRNGGCEDCLTAEDHHGEPDSRYVDQG